jgi:glyoxylase-like metal-dependent hydrolase (beta-lactamase superfamily II)
MSHLPGHLFAGVPKAQIQEALRRRNLPLDTIVMPYTLLYVDTGKHRVLLDTGAGNLAPSTGRLLDNLRAEGIEPADIDTVLITHAHPGHVGGALDEKGVPVYANARYYVSRQEWEFWTLDLAFSRASERLVSIARRNLEAIRSRATLVDRESECVPGIGVLPAPGHTPGHLVVSISSGKERLLYLGDTVLHLLHLEHPNWTSIYDVLPKRAAASRHRMLDLAAKENAMVCAHHLAPFPGLGHVIVRGEGWQWRPIRMGQRS